MLFSVAMADSNCDCQMAFALSYFKKHLLIDLLQKMYSHATWSSHASLIDVSVELDLPRACFKKAQTQKSVPRTRAIGGRNENGFTLSRISGQNYLQYRETSLIHQETVRNLCFDTIRSAGIRSLDHKSDPGSISNMKESSFSG